MRFQPSPPSSFSAGASSVLTRLRLLECALVGHKVDNHLLKKDCDRHDCRCGTRYLSREGALTRVRHTLSCFLGTHSYVHLADRHGCSEYVCVQCGHPLVYPARLDPYRDAGRFRKKVRYRCGLFGHRTVVVVRRNGFVEHACHCGHSFLMPDNHGGKIRHPLLCVLLGHYVRFVTSRRGYDEFVCVTCGHPFCFARAAGCADAGDSAGEPADGVPVGPASGEAG